MAPQGQDLPPASQKVSRWVKSVSENAATWLASQQFKSEIAKGETQRPRAAACRETKSSVNVKCGKV
jgi:hypothetical protein